MSQESAKPSRRSGAAGRARRAPAAKPDLDAYRRRMNAIGKALSAVFVGMESADSDLWGRGLYLKLVGKLYEALDCDDLPLEDLQALSRMISEQRRAQTQAMEAERRLHAQRSTDGDDDDENAGLRSARELPSRFKEVVQQIYGVNLQQESGQ